MILFSSWWSVIQIVVTGATVYVALVLLLRLFGKRSLAKFNAFDWVITVAIGSTLATALLQKSVSIVDGIVALTLLLGAQFAVAWLQVRSQRFRHAVKSEPAILMADGRWLDDTLARERVTRDAVLAAVRSSGIGRLDDVKAVVLETTGDMSVIPRDDGGGPLTSLAGVAGVPSGMLSAEAAENVLMNEGAIPPPADGKI